MADTPISHGREKRERHAAGITLLALLSAFSLLSGACHKNARGPVVPPPTPRPPSVLEQADAAYQSGDYRVAVSTYEEFLKQPSPAPETDRVLFRLALMYAIPGSAARDGLRSTALLNRLIRDYGKSPLRPEAEYILALQSEIEKLRADVRDRDEKMKRLALELEKLKKIDMERRPVRPPDN